MLKKILLVVAAAVIVFIVAAALQSPDFRVTRSASIAASPADIFAQVDNLHNWDAWSPWAKLDPAAKSSFEGPQSGVGAVYAWSGNSEVGEGRMTITESRQSDLVRLRLDFVKPMQSTSDVEFTFKPEGAQTVVTWSMYGKKNFVAKAMGLFMDCDKICGEAFEKGLAQIKAITEGAKRSS